MLKSNAGPSPALINRLIKHLSALLSKVSLPKDEADEVICALVALLCLARAGLVPGELGGSQAGVLLVNLARDAFNHAPQTDDSNFCRRTMAVLQPISQLLKRAGDLAMITATLRQIATDTALAPLFSDHLAVGWTYQYLLKQGSDLARRSPAWHAARREGIDAAEIARMTQWFTPQWIAQFLVEKTVGARPTSIFLDPACGAGHILVPALQSLVAARQQQRKETRLTSLTVVLEKQLFALDIDPYLAHLSAFALYLTCRQLEATADLPVPRIFTFACLDKSEDHTHGSLWLGVEKRPSALALDHLGEKATLGQLPDRFSAIATNPPYLSHRRMPDQTAKFLREHYASAHYDLYAAFLSLSRRIAASDAAVAMVCQQSFLTIQRYQKLRTELLDDMNLSAIVQLGSGTFSAKSGEKANNAIVVLQRRSADDECTPSEESSEMIECWRLLSNEEKKCAELSGLEAVTKSLIPARDARALFNSLESAPLAFWCPPELAALFQKYPPLESDETGLTGTNGLFTCDNKRFVRKHWEVDETERNDYVPYDKGGGHKWYRTTPYMVLWQGNGDQIRGYRKERGQSVSLPGEDFYFMPGVTYSYIGTKGFKARLLSPNSIFDIASSAIFSKTLDHIYVLGFLNSALVRFLLGVLNPTINFQIGDLRRLPFIIPDKKIEASVVALATKSIEIARELETFVPQSPTFAGHALRRYASGKNEQYNYERHVEFVNCANRDENEYQRQIDELIFELYEVSMKTRQNLMDDPWVKRGHEQLCKIPSWNRCLMELRSEALVRVP